jgi:pimeloyl-ACP methyl ester carboxylesterase
MNGTKARNGLWVEQLGDAGDVLVLIHGLGANGAVWDPLLALAAQEWKGRIIVPDLRGHGRSKHFENYSLGTMTADIAELLQSTDRVSIIGHSLGGALGAFIGTGWFGLNVELVLALSVKVKWSQDEILKGRSVAQNPVKWLSGREEALDRYMKVAGLAGCGVDMSRSANAGVVEAAGRFRTSIDPRIFGSASLGVDKIMQAVACDFTLIGGANDPIAPVSEMTAAGFHASAISDAGHNVHVTAPGAVWKVFEDARTRVAASRP